MNNKNLIRIATFCMASVIALTPVNEAAAALLKKGSRGSEVTTVQITLKELGYFNYTKATGYYGSITANAVKKFQKDYGITSDGIVGKSTRNMLKEIEEKTEEKAETQISAEIVSLSAEEPESETPSINPSKTGDLDWFKRVQHIFKRGDIAEVMDVKTGRTFYLKRTFGTNHADVEPLTREDTNIIKDIWGGWSWTRRAVVVKIDGYYLAGSLSAMPHAGVDSKQAVKYVSGRSGGYGWGQNLDAVKNNGANGVLDLHFKNSRNHNTNKVKKAHQDMVKKANTYIEKNFR